MHKERIFDDVGHLKEDVPICSWFLLQTCRRLRVRVPVVAKAGFPLSSIGTVPLRSTPKIRRRCVVAASVISIFILAAQVAVELPWLEYSSLSDSASSLSESASLSSESESSIFSAKRTPGGAYALSGT